MSQITIITGTHPQSNKPCKLINILGTGFIYADKRGHSMHDEIPCEFAKQIIAEIPAEVLHTDRVKFLTDNQTIKLSWSCYSPGKAKRAEGAVDTYELRIHAGSEHVYSSKHIAL